MSSVSVDVARSILGDDVLGPEEVALSFGSTTDIADAPIQLSRADLEAARTAGSMLVYRVARCGESALTILQMIALQPSQFDQRFLRKMGYQLKDEWGIELEPGAGTDTCQPGWALVHKAPLAQSLNLAFDQQEECLGDYAKQLGLGPNSCRRRSGVEIVFDTLLYSMARGRRLLTATWDWSGTRTVDGGYLNVGGFGAQGLQVLSYSRAVRHGALGVCPTRQIVG